MSCYKEGGAGESNNIVTSVNTGYCCTNKLKRQLSKGRQSTTVVLNQSSVLSHWLTLTSYLGVRTQYRKYQKLLYVKLLSSRESHEFTQT